MKPSLSLAKKNRFPFKRRAIALTFFLAFFFSILFIPLYSVRAQMATVDFSAVAQRIQINTGNKMLDRILTSLAKAGSVSFQQLMKTALNKIAYDTATYVGSGGKGQKPLFVTEDWGKYIVDIGNRSAGQFIENFVNTFADSMAPLETQKEYGDCASGCENSRTSCIQGIDYDDTKDVTDAAAAKCGNDFVSCVRACRERAAGVIASTSYATVKVAGESGASRRIVNVCEPSSVQAKLKISLGLADTSEPNMPNCSATELIQNWGDEYKRLANFENPDFLNMVENAFDPVSNDLGIYMSLKTDLTKQVEAEVGTSKLQLAANKGWLDVRNIAGEQKGTPGSAEDKKKMADMNYGQALFKTTGDIIVDAANLFLNQLSLTAFNNLMDSLGERAKSSQNFSEYVADPTVAYGEVNIKEAAVKVIPLNLRTDSDYNVLIGLSSCPDKKNPGPTECVIDNLFMQAISEKKTVLEAVNSGYLNKDWVFTKDNKENTYTLRNISILRKYRILPLAWEQVIERIYDDPEKSDKRQKATLMDLIYCFDGGQEYEDFSRDFDPNDLGWCEGLIDPHWVLKAPLGYCAKEGIGGQVVFGGSTPGNYRDGVIIPSVYNITRADNYCADEQTCIKENSLGGCDVYGYCNEEKRIWKFSSNSCEPVYNTCQTFTNSNNGKQVSYLKNTLDYGDCNADNAGCSRYSISGDFSDETGTITWNPVKSLYLTKMEGCSRSSEGCTELIRVKPTWGANLIMNSGFIYDEVGDAVSNRNKLNDWPISASSTTYSAKISNASDAGGGSGDDLALLISASGPSSASSPLSVRVYSEPKNSLIPDNFELINGESYTLSADVYVVSGEKAIIYLGTSGTAITAETKETISTGRWENISVTRTASDNYYEPLFGIQVVDTRTSSNSQVSAYIKNIKFELSNIPTDYSFYSEYRVYQKLIPPYLENTCYVNNGSDYTLKDKAPAICGDFTRRCNSSEAGCELFVNSKKSLNIAAKVTSSDYCSGKCVGYDMYISRQDYFNPAQAENIIPAQMAKCSAAAVGCNEFTNLDKVDLGGESLEYYSELKQCIKPSSECSSFYNWERTANGSQLRLYNLQKDDISGNPKVTTSDAAECNAEIFKKLPGDPLYNPDCKEFYNINGQISYHLLSRTITCSENCVSYRLSAKNFDYSLTQSDCSDKGSSAHWDGRESACQVCLNGGLWDNQLSACVYKAIPGEGQKCSAAEKGCREYNGNDGDNLKILSSYNFELGMDGWNSNCSKGLIYSDISSSKNGHSLFYKANANDCGPIGSAAESAALNNRLINKVFAADNVAAQIKVGQKVSQGKSYTLRFIAKSNQGDTKLKIYFYNNKASDPKIANFGAPGEVLVKGGDTWNVYQVNLGELDHAVDSEEILIISADKDFYFDEVILTEISNRYYLIKDSGIIPNDCFFDVNGRYQGDKYNLGCSAYTDRAGNIYSLRKFSSLCSNSSVGCEQMVKTQNNDSYKSETWRDANNNGDCDPGEDGCIKVAADEAIYAVYNNSKVCNSADKGCSLLGQMTNVSNDWSDVYKKNNPSLYEKTICKPSDLGCSTWKTKEGGFSYFKDPLNKVCQYRSGRSGESSAKSWYLIPSGSCDDGSKKACNSDKDCGKNKCIIDNNDYPCEISYLKTFGLGGNGNVISTPTKEAGLCEPAASGCTEYIDPLSQISPNLIGDPEYKSDSSVDFWTSGSQVINIEQNKLYSFSVIGGSSVANLAFNRDAAELILPDNILGGNFRQVSVSPGSNFTFLSLSNTSVTVSGPERNRMLILKEVIVNYQLQEAVNKSECKIVNIDNGCVLFNERSVNGTTSPVSLLGRFNAFASSENKAPVSCGTDGKNCNANSLIKVSPDRICSKWLDCSSYTINEAGQKVCYTVKECNRLEGTECVSYEEIGDNREINFNYGNVNKNATGYLLLNRFHLSNMKEVGLNTDVHYDFEDIIPAISCQRMDNRGECNFDNIAKELLVREPAGAPVKYPASGRTYLKVPAGHLIYPQSEGSYAKVVQGRRYYINFLVNTEGGDQAFIRIVPKGRENTASKIPIDASNSGWSRRIVGFNATDYSELRIELGTDSPFGAVYFDDINIEPVLQVGPDEYVAKECRLYPTEDSLTCFNKNDTTVKDGLEGYCLEHDKNNSNVCLMWYPVDKISAARTSANTEGYKGKYPLNYCTEVDGNFDLVKKLEGKPVLIDNFGKAGSVRTENNGGCYIYDENSNNWKEIGKSFWTKVFDLFKNGNEDITESYAKHVLKVCPSEYKPIVAVGEEEKRKASFMKVMCIPKEAKLIENLKTEQTVSDMNACDGYVYHDGWTKYDGFLKKVDFAIIGTDINEDGGSGADVCQESKEKGEMNPWCMGEYKGINEAGIVNPIRVFDYNRPPFNEDDLKLISGSDPDKAFRLTCNNFIQMVDSTGENKAWADRVSINSIFATSTPIFFRDYGFNPGGVWYGSSTSHNLQSYGRKREEVPFGAALFPDNFDLLNSGGAINLRNQYSAKMKESVLAGRPYGCSNYKTTDSGLGCNNIGYCSLNPNVYCISSVRGSSNLQISVDDKFEAYLNDRKILSNQTTPNGDTIGLSTTSVKFIKGEKNVLAIKAVDTSKESDKNHYRGIAAEIEGLMSTNSISGWKCSSSTPPVGWTNVNFNDSAWPAAVFRTGDTCSNCESNFTSFKQIWAKDAGVGSTVYCRYSFVNNTDGYVSQRTCSSGGFGTCVPLWGDYLGSKNVIDKVPADYESILSQLFLKSYGSYSFSGETYSLGRIGFDKLSSTTSTPPVISGVKLTLNGKTVVSGDGSINLPEKNLYRLEFNTAVNKEQQPLREIYIDWGDGNYQVIKGEDNRVSGSAPHIVYHYYSSTELSRLTIEIKDNWDKKATWSSR